MSCMTGRSSHPWQRRLKQSCRPRRSMSLPTGAISTAPRPETSGNRKKGMFVKADFVYDTAADTYTCPAGKVLTYRYTREENGLMHRRYWQNDCQFCALKERCTTGKERRITRWEHEHLIEAMYARMDESP